ncbi:hypothetical protein Q4I28_000281 [Leishmania naiffi]|uniref:PDZ domain-containing protein n=1 Tax=Leishmania naiffi TaxID=5678 RepID=A0AAW3CCH9_9TRYP
MSSSTQLLLHSERGGSGSNITYPHRVEGSLASELNTLCQLRDFYEQHTFDAQGPYADLFEVLLSSCKHMIDINVELVHHIKAQEDKQQRQQVFCDFLCGEVEQQRAEIKDLRVSLAHVSARGASGEAVAKDKEDSARLASNPAASPHAFPRSEATTKTCAQCVSKKTSAALGTPQPNTGAAPPPSAAPGPERPPPSTASPSVVERSALECATTTLALKEAPTKPSSPLTHSSASEKAPGEAWAAEMLRRMSAMQDHLDTLLVDGRLSSTQPNGQQQQQPSSTALFAPSETRKQPAEEAADSHLEHLGRHLPAVEKLGHKQQRPLRRMWEEGDVGSSSPSLSPASTLGAAAESSLPNQYAATATHARPNPQESSQRQGTSVTSPASARGPPLILVRWIDSRLHQWEAEWQRVLEEVQNTLIHDAAVGAQALGLTSHAAAQQEAHVSLRTAQESDSEGNGLTEAVMTPRCRGDFVCAIRTLLSLQKTDLCNRVVAESTRQVQHIEEALCDMRARLEALEVYAPHLYSVTARPPLLGVELEDVLDPRIGVRLRSVYHGYLADRAGLSVGDVLLGVGHQSIQTRGQLYAVLRELTRDYNAQCQLQIEAGFMRSFALGDECCASDRHCVQSASHYREETMERKVDDYGLDQELQRARSEAAAAAAGGTRAGGARPSAGVIYRRTSPKGSSTGADSHAAASPFLSTSLSVTQHREKLAQHLPYFELCLHVVRDGRLRDVTLLIPPLEALRTAAY